jgi:hypothetical protein
MSVRAKFKCHTITEREGLERGQARPRRQAHPRHSGSDENKQFYAATPGGSVEIACANAEAAAQFVIGREYYVDFTPAD